MPKYRNSVIPTYKSNLVKKTKEQVKSMKIDPGKSITSSFCIPSWNFQRLLNAKRQLEAKNIHISVSELAFLCLKYFLKHVERKNPQQSRACRYNDEKYRFVKVSFRLAPDEYNAFLMKKIHIKSSLSYLIDLAIRKNLQFILKLLTKEAFFEKTAQRLNRLRTSWCSYHKKIIENTAMQLSILEVLHIPLKI